MVFKFTVDNIFNPYIPQNRVSKLPKPLARFLGSHNVRPMPDYYIWIEILLGSFAGVALLEGIFKSPNVFTTYHHAPMILASYGATAILCLNASQVPVAQPRNILVGHFIAAAIGMGIQKLFSLSEVGQQHYWASGALSVAVSSVVMSIGNCIHPPAGASAILPSVDAQIREMSWWYLPVQLISSVLMIAVACITGNIIRRYPVYWWTPAEVGRTRVKDEEEKVDKPSIDQDAISTIDGAITDDDRLTRTVSGIEGRLIRMTGIKAISITSDRVIVPEDLAMDGIDRDWLEGLQHRLQSLED